MATFAWDQSYSVQVEQLDAQHKVLFETINELAEDIRQNPRPILLECMTFRMRGHEEASGTKYVPQHLFDEWKEKDPVTNFEKFLLDENGKLIHRFRSGVTPLDPKITSNL